MPDYASAVRQATLAAARLHRDLGSEAVLTRGGGNVDVFAVLAKLGVPMLLRPLSGLLGAFLRDPMPGILITTERPLSIQRFTAGHELGHFRMKHQPSLDDETILRRSPFGLRPGYDVQEVEADAFAVAFMTPRWLIAAHCKRQHWSAVDLRRPEVVYQLSLRLGASYEATCWTLVRYKLLPLDIARQHLAIQPRRLKQSFLSGYRPENFRGDVWLLTGGDEGTVITGSKADLFVLRLPEHGGGGYLWDMDQIKETSFAIVRDEHEAVDPEGVGANPSRLVTVESQGRQIGTLQLFERRPWQPTKPINTFSFTYDLNGPEAEGYSRAERRQLLEAA
jgi:Zn-dependent peptidase ImmA (M78 family)